MSLDVAERIVAEAERLRREEEEALCVVLKYTLVFDTYETLKESVRVVSPLPDRSGSVQVLFKSMRWRVEAASQMHTLMDHLLIALFSEAFGGFGSVENVHLEVLHQGASVLRVCWPQCSELSLEDIQTGAPEARELLEFFGRYADLGVRGAGIQLTA